MKIAHIVGNRPQFIKLALLHRGLGKRLKEGQLIIHTGQHYDHDMSDVFFRELAIPQPDYQLQINGLPHAAMIGKMIMELDSVLALEKPGCVVVYGDTNTTLAGALAAKKRNIPLAHIEAGIRTGNEGMPEESNRYLTDRMAGLNFTCTRLGLENLMKEGFGNAGGTIPSRIYNTGDLMYDASLLFSRNFALQADTVQPVMDALNPGGGPYLLATVHREENTGNVENLRNIISALNALHREIPVIFPVHPGTRRLIEACGIPLQCTVSGPLGHFDMLGLIRSAGAVLTDSGGLSREAFFFSRPALVIMQFPFWPEIIDHGNCLQSGALTEEIIMKTRALLKNDKPFDTGIFGDGGSAEKISGILLSVL